MKKLYFYLLIFLLLLGIQGIPKTGWTAGEISGLTALEETPASGDLLEVLDISDTTMAPTGTNKKVAYSYLIPKGYLWIPAGAMIPDTTSGLLQLKASNNQFDYIAFDGGTDEYVTIQWAAEDWDLGTIKAKFIYLVQATSDAAQTVVWGLSCVSLPTTTSISQAITTGRQEISNALTTGVTTGPQQIITAKTPAITVDGTLGQANINYCRVDRDASADTHTTDALLLGIKIEYGRKTATAW